MKRRSGFTLLEVLIALAVVSLALLALGRGSAQQVQNQAELQERTLALWVADNVISGVRLDPVPAQPGRYQGSERMGAHDWHWEMLIQASPDPGVLRIDVVVHGDPQRQRPVLQHTGFVHRR